MASESKKFLDISNLMSPPEPAPFESFSPSCAKPVSTPPALASMPASNITPCDSVGSPHPAQQPISPPISPLHKPTSNVNQTEGVKDPILFPSPESVPSPRDPLFVPCDSTFQSDAHRLVDEHLASRPASLFKPGTTPPQRRDYELALYLKSEVMKKFMDNPKGWLRKERELLAADRKPFVHRSAARLPTILPAANPAPLRPTGNAKIQKPEKHKQQRQPKQARSPQEPSVRQARASPPSRATIRVSAVPEETRSRTVAPNREDRDFMSLEDLSPPISSLPSKSNSLKVDWKGNPLDLSKDPNAWRLHPDELMLAASLRLDCATYLTSKRRIFIRRLECAKIGKEFRKTDAQQACKIDVNKASKLWTAFEKVGWLDIHWMRPFL
ncbi:hypothetical protein VTK73DRAFT_5737 [Phialemonium thermophilum]|uniref:SWIRM domain-containing protein n=1 Tax=Phialemonium thermophilum TaxID=223376 RepID=A0ABR3WMC2_9PEZI